MPNITTGLNAEYPAVPGSKMESVRTFAGPTSYVAVTTGSPPTGGQSITAKQFGLVTIDNADGSGSDDGQYLVNIIYPTGQTVPGYAPASIILQWIVAATGAEVAGAVNLSARIVRLKAVGKQG